MAETTRNGTALMRHAATAVVAALAGAFMMMLFNSKALELQVATNTKNIDDLSKRVQLLEQLRAGDSQRIAALESKIDDIWKVVVLGERAGPPLARPRRDARRPPSRQAGRSRSGSQIKNFPFVTIGVAVYRAEQPRAIDDAPLTSTR